MNEGTWKEFKEFVDKKLAEKGFNDLIPIWYIDIAFPTLNDVEVEINTSMSDETIYLVVNSK